MCMCNISSNIGFFFTIPQTEIKKILCGINLNWSCYNNVNENACQLIFFRLLLESNGRIPFSKVSLFDLLLLFTKCLYFLFFLLSFLWTVRDSLVKGQRAIKVNVDDKTSNWWGNTEYYSQIINHNLRAIQLFRICQSFYTT